MRSSTRRRLPQDAAESAVRRAIRAEAAAHAEAARLPFAPKINATSAKLVALKLESLGVPPERVEGLTFEQRRCGAEGGPGRGRGLRQRR